MAVVVGHVIAGLNGSNLLQDDSYWFELNRWIYTWHMPLFVFLSGFLNHRLPSQSLRAFLQNQLETLVFPYALWGTTQTVFHIAASSLTNNHGSWWDLFDLINDPPLQFWFLYFLLLARVILYASVRYSGSFPIFVFAALSIVAVFYVFPSSPTSIPGRLRDNLPAFVLGVMLGKYTQDALQLSHAVLWTVLGAGAAISFLLLRLDDPILYLGWRCVLDSLIGCTVVVAFAMLFSKITLSRPFQYFGYWAFAIYILHVIAYAAARVFLLKFMGISNVAVHLTVGIGAGVLLPLVVNGLFLRVRINLFRYPMLASR